jgi:hypothetical protein
MYLAHIMNQIHYFFNVLKKLNLFIIIAGGSTPYGCPIENRRNYYIYT